jgi:hypothetical protein
MGALRDRQANPTSKFSINEFAIAASKRPYCPFEDLQFAGTLGTVRHVPALLWSESLYDSYRELLLG